jgi:hypothetical protein
MTRHPPKTEEEKAARRAQLAERRAERMRAGQREAQELLTRRKEQLSTATEALDRLRKELREVRRRESARAALSDHTTGFYDEIDKLAKGKSLLEVTKLIVDETNEIIRDAKALIEGDPFLDRVKEFVPAGNNPVYPDVVVSLKTVLQALGRAESQLESAEQGIGTLIDEADTIRAALYVLVEEDTAPSKDDVLRVIENDKLVDSWFVETHSGAVFDFEQLDQIDIAAHLSTEEEDL